MSNAQTAYDYYVSQGLQPHQSAGIVGNLQGESGQDLNPAAINKGDGRDGSDSIGIAQWNGTRAQALKDYAASKGVPWTDLNTQLEFLHQELQGPEKAAYGKLTAAQTPEEAGNAMLAFERPKDWNKPGAHPERAQYAAAAMKRYGAGQPTAAPAPTASPAGGILGGAPTGPLQPPATPVGAPLQITPQLSPTFPQAPQQASQQPGAGMDYTAQMPTLQAPQAPPIFYAPRRAPDISKLQAALGRAPIFPRG